MCLVRCTYCAYSKKFIRAASAEKAPTRQTAREIKLFRPRIKRGESWTTVCGIYSGVHAKEKCRRDSASSGYEINGLGASQGHRGWRRMREVGKSR